MGTAYIGMLLIAFVTCMYFVSFSKRPFVLARREAYFQAHN